MKRKYHLVGSLLLFILLITGCAYNKSTVTTKALVSTGKENAAKSPGSKADLSHSIGLKGVSNARDLGGYKGASGKKVKKGKLLRSGALYKATKKDIKKLKNTYHLAYVVDFRSAEVRAGKMDPVIKGVTNIFDPVFGEDTAFLTFEQAAKKAQEANGIIPVGNKTEKLITKVSNIGDVETVLGADYTALVTEPHSIEAYQKFFQIVLDNEDGSVLFHCSAGKDRTGVAAILLLSALGVKEDTIKKDYILTNDFIQSDVDKMERKISNAGGSEEIQNQAALSKGVAKSWGDSIFATIKSQYGSMNQYLKKEIGLSNKEKKKLRKMYLE